ncbi:PREDICTED: uncharacterized protein LOC108769513 [Trachymyrmex cornetzi]|uniref:uncharacterized protein LOC108769513 n=1 Tax=Trachymyrmex cornetzi TaxID=471704 RepID=UPI00084F75AC|nr:PREDICTED: uncharacterized protein LOC108769513 [Trachymyrmex cornetzi]
MMNSDDIDENIISLYNAQKWEEVAALSSASDNLKSSRLSWIFPDINDLYWINDIIRKYNLTGIASIGCGCGLLEWLLQKCSGLDVMGIELDSSWWHSKYSPPQFLKNIIFVENKSVNFQVPKRYAMLFCYFNNCTAFCNYMESYKGNLIFVIGPAQGNNCTTDPLPFDEKFKKYNWKLIKQKRLVCSNNYIVAYSNK